MIRACLRQFEGCILDLACGHGLVTAPLIPEGRRIFGLDYNQMAASSASRRGLIAVRADAFSLPFKEGPFDVVLSTEFIQQYDADRTKRLIEAMAQVTRPGGVVILVWRHGGSLMRQLITIGLRVLDGLRGRPLLQLFNHEFATVCGWARSQQLEMIVSLTVSPLLRLTIRNAESFASQVFGTSYIAVFRKGP